MAAIEWIARNKDSSPNQKLIARKSFIFVALITFLMGVCLIYLGIFSPIAHERLFSYFQRWNTIFIRVVLSAIQFFILVSVLEGIGYWCNVWKDPQSHPRITKVR